MTVVIKLDTAAMNTLFPEGTESRVQLARAVIENILKSLDTKLVIKLTEEVLGSYQPFINTEKKTLIKYFEARLRDLFRSVELTAEHRTKVRDHLSTKYNEAILSEVKDAEGEYLKNSFNSVLKKHIDDHVEYLIKSKLETYIKKVSNEYLSDKVRKLITDLER